MDYMKTDNKNTQYNLSPTFKVAQALLFYQRFNQTIH